MGTLSRAVLVHLLTGCLLVVVCRPDVAKAADDPFGPEIKAFEAADREKAPPRDAILFVGSSSIRLWKTLETDFPGITTIRRGFGGSTIRDCTRYADRIVIPYHPKRVILYAGDNDIASGRTAEDVLADYKDFVAKVRSGLPQARIEFISIKPSIARWPLWEKMQLANRLIEDFSKRGTDLGYIDVGTAMLGADGMPRRELFIEDGLHLNENGYELWRSIIAPQLK